MPVKMRLWCFPYAGASFYAYRELFANLPAHIEPQFLELPGRGKRFEEDLLTDFEGVMKDISKQVSSFGDVDTPFAFFGHSMGAQMAYSVAQQLAADGKQLPVHMFLSGRGAPAIVRMKRRYDLPDADFRKELEMMGGVPQDILKDKDFFKFFEPILRSDFQAIETYSHQPAAPLPVPFTVFLGDAEETTVEQAKAWQEDTSASFEFKLYKGGHFFIFEHKDDICKTIAGALQESLVA